MVCWKGGGRNIFVRLVVIEKNLAEMEKLSFIKETLGFSVENLGVLSTKFEKLQL